MQRDLDRLLRTVLEALDDLRVLRDAASADAGAREAVSHWLYHHWYLTVDASSRAADGETVHPNLPAALRASLPSASRWSAPWVVLEAGENGGCVAGRRGEARALSCGDYANVSRPGVPPMPGDAVAVVACVDRVEWETGFWTTRSATGEPASPLVRLYWSASVDAVGVLLGTLAGTLDALQLRYSLKCPARAADFARVDSVVLYLERTAWRSAATSMALVAHRSAAQLRDARPPLTRPVARGVGFAEDPGRGISFGQSRCEALAAGVLALLDGDPRSPAHRSAALLDALRRSGIDPGRPWLNPPAGS